MPVPDALLALVVRLVLAPPRLLIALLGALWDVGWAVLILLLGILIVGGFVSWGR